MDTILLVQRDPETRRAWEAALGALGARVVVVRSILAIPKAAPRERASVIVTEIEDEETLGELRWAASVAQLPPLVIVTDVEMLPPVAVRSRGAAVVPRGRPASLADAVRELLAARRQPAMNLPLRLPQVCETKWTQRLRFGFEAQDTWPGDKAA
ncbi:MAG TPA: hypothetical protein VL463_00530 [Kofleriaceae bacterium]|nr:hypothetical protein [Kofleriaceae bacterium]